MGSDDIRTLSTNDLHVIMAQFLSAACEIHFAMNQFSDGHVAQENLNNALHAALIGVEQCRQLHRNAKVSVEPRHDQ
jgi:hypothetical protein